MDRRLVLLVAAWLATPNAHTASVYHCRAYAGGEFWSSKRCDNKTSVALRVHTVPDGMSWENQVAMAAHQSAESARLAAPPPQPRPSSATTPRTTSTSQSGGLCKAWEAEVLQLDALARQPHSPQGLEDIRERRRALRDQQFRSRC